MKRNIENQTYKHKFTSTYFRFKTQDAHVHWMLIQNEMYPHVFCVNTGAHSGETKQNRRCAIFTEPALSDSIKKPQSVMPDD